MIKRKMETIIEELKRNEIYEDVIKELKTITLLKNVVSDETINEANKLLNFLNGNEDSYSRLYNLEKYANEQFRIHKDTIGKEILMMVSNKSINNSIQKSVIFYIIYGICNTISLNLSTIDFCVFVNIYMDAYKAAKRNIYVNI